MPRFVSYKRAVTFIVLNRVFTNELEDYAYKIVDVHIILPA